MRFAKRSIVGLGLALVLVLAACAGPAQQTTPGTTPQSAPGTQPAAPAAAGTFKIGVVLPLSGGAADYGIAYQNGIKMAVDDINKAGGVTVGGKKYNLLPVFCDDEFKSDKSVNCGKKLAADDKVKVIQTPASLSAFPMMGFNQQEGFVLMATSQTPRFTAEGNKLVVRYINNTDRTMGPWVDLMNKYHAQKNRSIKNVAIMEVNTDLGKSWVANFTKQWTAKGGTVSGKASYDANATDFYPQITTLLKGNPDSIVLTTVCQPSSIVIKQARELGFKGTFINSAACSGEELVKLLPAAQIEGTVFEVGAWGIPDATIENFKKEYRTRFNSLEPQLISGVGYEGVRWVAKALEAAGTVEDATKIHAAMPAALKGLKNMFDMANMDATGDIDFPMYLGLIEGGKISGFKG